MLWETTDPARLEAIIAVTRQATVQRPELAGNWESLARLLLRTDRDEEAIVALSDAVSHLPTEPRLRLMLADAYRRAGRPERLQEGLGRAPASEIGDREFSALRLSLSAKTPATDDAPRLAAEMLALDPTNPEAIAFLGRESRRAGRPQIMVTACQAALERDPSHTLARYELALAHALLGHPEDARKLIDLGRFIRVTDLPAPAAWGDGAAFAAALAGEIQRNPTLKADPAGKATRGGLQSGALPRVGDEAIIALLASLREAVDAFAADLGGAGDHPFAERRPKRARLRAWAVVVRGRGRQVAHIHPDGWLSGVYYVSVPQCDSRNARAGRLVLGSLDGKRLGIDPPWGTFDIEPARGRLALFPSYIPHATLPTESEDARICISFDVIPA